MKYSRGPFDFLTSTSPPRAAVRDCKGQTIASLIGFGADEQRNANGRLFAASYDLLIAAKSAHDYLIESIEPVTNIITMDRKQIAHSLIRAIKKAEDQ